MELEQTKRRDELSKNPVKQIDGVEMVEQWNSNASELVKGIIAH